MRAALAVIPNDNAEWQWFRHVLMATWGATAGSAEGLEAFRDIWSAKCEGKHDPAGTEAQWDEVAASPPSRIGAGTLIYLAREVDPDFKMVPREVEDDFDDIAWSEPEPSATIEIKPTSYKWRDPATIPLRRWLNAEAM